MKNFMIKQYINVQNFLKREDGASAIEYAIIAGLIAVGIIAAAGLLGDEIAGLFKSITDKLEEAKGVAGAGAGAGGD